MELRDQLQATLGEAYTIERELGGGGMSRVFVALETSLGRQVVIKVLSPELAAVVSAERFAREVKLAASLQHPHIVPLLNAGEAGGMPYYTMPFVDGQSLRERLAKGRLSVEDATSILRDIAKALVFAHSRGVVHRDIKPENILLAGDSAAVTDFGIAKAISVSRTIADVPSLRTTGTSLTEVGTSVGTPAYMAPEQAAGDPDVDHRADIYAFGCVAYELLTSEPPFGLRQSHQLVMAHMTEAPTPIAARRSDIPVPLAAMIMQCLEKAPGQRPQSARDLLPVLSAPAGVSHWPFAHRRGRFAIAAGAVIVIGAIAWRALARPSTDDTVHRVAVVPVIVASRDSTFDYITDGVADDLAAGLLQGHELSVINRSSANAFAAQSIDTRAAAKTLGVDHVIELKLRRTTTGVHVNVDMVNAADGVTRWTRAFDCDRDSVSHLGDRIASAIVGDLHVRTTAGITVRQRHQPTPAAYDAYQRERFFINRAAGKADFDSALVYFHRAVAADSNFADPYVAAALNYMEPPGLFMPSVQYDYEQSSALARRALALDPNNAAAHAVSAWNTAVLTWDWAGAQREFEQAVALDPSSAVAHLYYSWFSASRGDLDKAVVEARTAVHLDPYHGFADWMLMFESVATHQLDSAFAVQRLMDATVPEWLAPESSLADAYRERGRIDTSFVLDSIVAVRGGSPGAGLVVALARLGRHADAERTYRQMAAFADTAHTFFLYEVVGRAALAAGHHAEAIAWFEKAMRAHSDYMLIIRFHPDMRPLLSDPGYLRLLHHMGISH